MANSNTLPIFLDSYKLLTELYKVTINFPREYKFSIGQDIQKDAMELLRCIYRANTHQNKSLYLEDFGALFESVRLEIRLSHELHIISDRKFVHLAKMMEPIGKQYTAWQKYEKKKQQKPSSEEQRLMTDAASTMLVKEGSSI